MTELRTTREDLAFLTTKMHRDVEGSPDSVNALMQQGPNLVHDTNAAHDLAADNAKLTADNARLREALKEWVDLFDQLDEGVDPSDPLREIRHQYHGQRVERSRAALAATTPTEETK